MKKHVLVLLHFFVSFYFFLYDYMKSYYNLFLSVLDNLCNVFGCCVIIYLLYINNTWVFKSFWLMNNYFWLFYRFCVLPSYKWLMLFFSIMTIRHIFLLICSQVWTNLFLLFCFFQWFHWIITVLFRKSGSFIILSVDMIVDMESKSNCHWIIFKTKKLNILLAFISQSYFKVPKTLSLYVTHYFIMKIPNKELKNK